MKHRRSRTLCCGEKGNTCKKRLYDEDGKRPRVLAVYVISERKVSKLISW